MAAHIIDCSRVDHEVCVDSAVCEAGDGGELKQVSQYGMNGSQKPRRKYSKAPGGKRTKTGCLTCRNRRVKCTEEKPNCRNCIKAHRECEGYNQKLRFKVPMTHSVAPWSTSKLSSSREPSKKQPPKQSLAKPLGLFVPNHPITSNSDSTSSSTLISPVQGNIQTFSLSGTASSTSPEHIQPYTTDNSESAPSLVDPRKLHYNLYVVGQAHKKVHMVSTQDTNSDLINVPGSRSTSPPTSVNHKDLVSIGTLLPEVDNAFDRSQDELEIDAFVSEFENNLIEDHKLNTDDVNRLIAFQSQQPSRDISLRSYTSLIDGPNMLATYTPSYRASPLRDSMTAKLFYHFINVTAPSMSMFQRYPTNTTSFQGSVAPKSWQQLWTYTFPALALQNQTLLQCMLAVASLHIAKLQNGPATPSLKHYAYALRGVAKDVGLPHRRGQPATLAAALLLAFYEVWTSDHAKWINHLLGATQLVREIDFVGIARYVKATKKAERAQQQSSYHFQPGFEPVSYQNSRMNVDEVDENLVSMLMGKRLQYDQSGRVVEDEAIEPGSYTYTRKDIDVFELNSDLWWTYAKQDVYQSILGGGPLFLSYDLWSHCPPRAPIGQLRATYGTFDHLVLLLGRLADFMARDSKRKRSVMDANGGQWRPACDMAPPPPPMTPQQGKSEAFCEPPPMPDFDGMIPGVPEPELPMGFGPTQKPCAQNPIYTTDLELEAATLEAEEEWLDIRNAFAIFEDHLGVDFQALGPDFSMPIDSPFGPSLQYRTYNIAGMWMNYYMGLIVCHRAHPSMPPAAMMAAGIVANQTAYFANELGRIAAGITPDCSRLIEVNPSVGAALIESTTTLFTASIQYQDAAQRAWTVNRLRDITRLTGWHTAIVIATGCETAWTAAAKIGRGPPYTKTGDESASASIWQSQRELDRTVEEVTDDDKLVLWRGHQVHFAMGLLGVPEDLDKLRLDNGHGEGK